jgi:periplasmic copper chaperone A
MNLRRTLLGALAVGLVAVPVASAHVTLSAKTAPAGSFQYVDVRVPNERPNAATTRVAVDIPAGILSVSAEAKPGWHVRLIREPLTTPASVFGTQINSRVARVVWFGGKIAPGQFGRFGLSILMPSKQGARLAFLSTQTYSSGEIVRWNGPESAETPAPRITLTRAQRAM